VPREQAGWRLQAAGSGEFRIFNCTGPVISATFGLIGWVTEATHSTPGVWPLRFLRLVISAVAARKSARVLEPFLHSDEGNVVNSFAVATLTWLGSVFAGHARC